MAHIKPPPAKSATRFKGAKGFSPSLPIRDKIPE